MSRFNNLSTLYTTQKTVTTSGTPVQLDSKTMPPGVCFTIKAKEANVGVITMGGSSADALNSGTTHYKLKRNETMELNLQNTNMVWIDSTNSGDGVEIIAEL